MRHLYGTRVDITISDGRKVNVPVLKDDHDSDTFTVEFVGATREVSKADYKLRPLSGGGSDCVSQQLRMP